MNEITVILERLERGDRAASEQLLPLVYDQLRKLAAQKLAQEKPGQTLQATALVHEAYLRLARSKDAATGNEARWDGRGHFYAAAAEAMRRILIENARRKQGPKQGGQAQRVDLDINLVAADLPEIDLLALDEALNRLAAESPVRAELVKLRFFAGLTVPEAAEALGVSLATAERYWTYARTWLFSELGGAP